LASTQAKALGPALLPQPTITLAPQLAQQQQPRTALIIANYAYGGDDDLIGPRQDAAAMYEKLRSMGFDVPLPVTNATKQQMEQAMRDFVRRMRPGGANIFYYSGHGVQIGGANYLLPVGLAKDSVETDVIYNAVRLDYIVNQMQRVVSEFNFLIIDACRNTPFYRRWNRPKGSGSQGLALIAPPAGTMIAYAAEPGEVANDGDDKSPFTASLLNYLGSSGITIYDMLHRTQEGVLSLTNQDQRPVWEGSPNKYDFSFLPIAAGPTNPPGPGVTPPPPGPANPPRLGVINVSPWKYFPEPGYSVQNFTQNSNSFDFTVNNTRGAGVIPYGIQIISSNPVPLEQGKRYRMRFQISASESFELVTRLGEHNYQNSIFINEVFNVGQPEETFELVFTAEQYTRSSALYFQFGNAPTGTRVKVSDIQIEPLP